MVILEAICRHSLETPGKIALYEGGKEVTYACLWEHILRAAAYFSSIGRRGDRVLLAASKSADFVYAYFGAHLAGLIAVPIDSEINENRLRRILLAARPLHIYGNLSLSGYEVSAFPATETLSPLSRVLFPDASEPADLLFTTGTTGLPKGVLLSHANQWAAATQINAFIGTGREAVELLALPVSHSFGLGRLRCILQLGATIDLLGSFASMKKFYRELDTRGITGFGMVPASWLYIRKMSGSKIEKYAGQLQYIEIGSAAMPLDEKHYLLSALPATRLCMHYGLTEASRSAFICFNQEPGRLSSIGRAAPGVEIRVMDEHGKECAAGEEGEICVRGAQVCAGYWGSHAGEYAASFHGGYFRTGDWGYADAEGWLYLKSRKKELMNVGGKKVSPLEVEEVLNEIPGVRESACRGIPDPVLGEVVKAYVVWEGGEAPSADLILQQAAAGLEAYKVPRAVEFIAELPRTASGKIQRLYLK